MGSESSRPIKELWPNPENPRHDIRNDPNFAGLVLSITSEGILQPLLIRADGMILAGHRRYEAALMIGLESVPVHVVSENNTHALVPLIENLQRRDLAVLEVADYVRLCHREFQMTIDSIADATGISKSTLCKYLKLAEGPEVVRYRVERDEIPLNAAFELLRHEEPFIREVVKTPVLTKQIVRDKAIELGSEPRRIIASALLPAKPCPTDLTGHLEHAIHAIKALQRAAPNEAIRVRYQRWLNVMEDDLSDAPKQATTFAGSIDALQRQPSGQRGWKAG